MTRAPLGVVALVGGVLAVLGSLGCSVLGSECDEFAAFGERRLVPVELEAEGAFRPQELVGYTWLRCGEDVGEQRSLLSVAGVPPEVALRDGERGDLLYVAAGRCGDVDGLEALGTCLRERLVFEDRWYTRASVDDLRRGRELGTAVLYAGLEPQQVEVVSLDEVDPEDALATVGDTGSVWVADGSCYEVTAERLRNCLLATG